MNNLDYNCRKEILRATKNDFKDKIGKYTHQKMSKDWHFRSLAFVRDNMTYVFGFNVGFFRKDTKNNLDFQYDYVGMNALIRTNGLNPELRKKYQDFFNQHLKAWILQDIGSYTSFRGGIGVEFARLQKTSTFTNKEQIIDFIKSDITKFANIWQHIATNPNNIFTNVVRAAPTWDETILELAISNTSKTH